MNQKIDRFRVCAAKERIVFDIVIVLIISIKIIRK